MFNSSARSFLFNLIKDRSIYVITAFILSFVSTIFDISAIILFVPIFSIFFNLNTDIYTINTSFLVSRIFSLQTFFIEENKFIFLVTFAICLIVMQILGNYLVAIVNIQHTKHLSYELKCKGFALLCEMNIDYYKANQIGDILLKINREINKTALAIKSIKQILINSAKIIIFTLVLVLISLKLSLITLLLIGSFIAVNNYAIASIKKKEILSSKKSQIYNHRVVEFLRGIQHIKNTANEKKEYQVIIAAIQNKNKATLKNKAFSALISPINKILGIIFILILTLISYYLYGQQLQAYMPILLVYFVVLFKILPLIIQLDTARNQLKTYKFSVENVVDFLDKTDKPIIKSGKKTFHNLQNKIELQNVTFAYPHQAKIVLDKINFNIAKGETIAVIGSTGAGKTTIINLLSRHYEPIEGNIFIDTRDIAEYTLASLRKSILVIDRNPFLFDNSILYNLTYGLNNISESDVIAAAKKTKAYNFISQFSQGLFSIVASEGIILSEGQKLLISITRGLLSNPAIIVLDECMANLNESERKIVQDALNQLCCDRTTIIITNRLNTIKKADQIIVLSKGKVIESGTHQELLKNGNLYKRMCSAQFKTSQQSHQQILAKKISTKLSRQANSNLSYEIRNNLNSLLNYLQLINEGSIENDLEQEKILDESYQAAKNMLASLREYERKILRGFRKKD